MKKFYNLLLTFLIVLPSLISIGHYLFEEHQHCNDTKIHFHKTEKECSYCYVINNNDNNSVHITDVTFTLFSINSLVIDFIENPTSNNLRTFNLRAPPVV